MGEPSEQPPERRKGTIDDIAGFRLYYRLAGDPPGAERHIDWPNDRGPTIAEAMAVKQATTSNVSIGRMWTVLRSTDEGWEDPEALQAVVWMVRRFRMGETDLKITALDGLDMFSVRQDYFDAQRRLLDFYEDEPTDEQRLRALAVAAELRRLLPGMSEGAAHAGAIGLVVAWPDEPPEEGPGEAPAGGDAGDPAATPAPTRKTSKRTSGSGSRNSRSSTGSAGRTSSATPRGRGSR